MPAFLSSGQQVRIDQGAHNWNTGICTVSTKKLYTKLVRRNINMHGSYSASLYVNNRYGVEWFVLFGGVTCGIAASALWASEGAIALGYGDIKDRGKFSEHNTWSGRISTA